MNESPETHERPWALVTGASAGIGKAFCEQLAAQQFDLVLVARRRERLEELSAAMHSAHGTRSHIIVADLTDPGAPGQIADELDQAQIAIDTLINNAGYGVPGRLLDSDWDTHRDFIQIMVTAVVELSWLFLPGMQARGRGAIVNIASVAGLTPASEGHTLYAASKAFLVKFSESLALEAKNHGVAVSALCPGFTYSEFHDVAGTRDKVSKLPKYLWLQADEVVRYGLDSVHGAKPRSIAIPGAIYRLLVWVNGAFPWLGRYLTARHSSKFRKLD